MNIPLSWSDAHDLHLIRIDPGLSMIIFPLIIIIINNNINLKVELELVESIIHGMVLESFKNSSKKNGYFVKE